MSPPGKLVLRLTYTYSHPTKPEIPQGKTALFHTAYNHDLHETIWKLGSI